MALVVTIVILLILAGITIASLTGENGIIGKSGEAKNATEKSQEKEELEVAVLRFTDKRGNLDATKVVDGINKDIKNLNSVTAIDGKFPVMVEYKNGHKYGISKDGNIIENIIVAGETAPNDSNAPYISGAYVAVIPAGFTVSDVKVVNENTGIVEKDETTIESGLVIKDNSGNEWVWIPVNSTDLTTLYEEDTTGYTMSGTGGETETDAVITKYRTTGTQTRVTPGDTSGYREPDIVVGTGTQYDNAEVNWKAAGFSSYKNMAESLRDDYINMINSIKKHGGFYVGRYELSNAGTQKNQVSLTNKTWYEFYEKCKTLGNNFAISRMIWGCQWDQVCKFISTGKDTNGNKIDLIDSSKYGNYYNAQYPANTGNYEQGKKKNTGSNEAWKTNNIYDLAGNCYEWSQEAYSTTNRARRGGGYSRLDAYPVTGRNTYGNSTSWNLLDVTTRPVLYIK